LNKMRKILSIISEENTVNTDALSKKLDMGTSTLKAVIDFMVHQGYLEEIDCGRDCNACPVKCNVLSSEVKMYKLTEKGMKYTELNQGG